MMITKAKYSLIMYALFAFVNTGVGQEIKSFLSVQDILSIWQSNYSSMKSMKVSYVDNVVAAEPSKRDPNFANRLIKWVHVERIEEGKKFRMRSSKTKEGFADINKIEESTYDGVNQKRYFPVKKMGQVFGSISDKGEINRMRQILLSDPYIERSGVESDESVFSKTVKKGLYDSNYVISVRPNLEEVSGQMCHVLELVTNDEIKDKAAIIWVAHEKGMLPMKFQYLSRGIVSKEILVVEIDFAKSENGGLWFPKKAFEISNNPESIGFIKQEFNVLEFVPNIKTDPNTFKLDFPSGTYVGDAELGINYTVGVK
jgi:hypothetical protein